MSGHELVQGGRGGGGGGGNPQGKSLPYGLRSHLDLSHPSGWETSPSLKIGWVGG